ncbi:hypothetical protein ACOBQJ_16195 [Pelotomaculum propionicicum]|uniref:hypothetical protein n=1 Tax=Pelotomaculum propionicicum TaxID=258475 RepID=UPI003B7E4D48
MDAKGAACGGRSISQREAWVTSIFNQVKEFIGNYNNVDIKTCSSLSTTSLKNSYVRGQVFPFINIPIRCREKELLGLYEYFGEQLPLSDEYIYCDFVVHSIYYHEKKSPLDIKAVEDRTRQILSARGYEILNFEEGMATITISRKVLENEGEFLKLLKNLLDEAIKIQAETL